jgi:hypothetical protein
MSQKVSASASDRGRGGGGELAGQDVSEAAFFGFDDGAGVVRDQAARHGFGVVDVAEVAGTVRWSGGFDRAVPELLPEITPMSRTLGGTADFQEESELSEVRGRYLR